MKRSPNLIWTMVISSIENVQAILHECREIVKGMPRTSQRGEVKINEHPLNQSHDRG